MIIRRTVSSDQQIVAAQILQGVASGMFSAIPQNLTAEGDVVDYANTGAWSKKAISEVDRPETYATASVWAGCRAKTSAPTSATPRVVARANKANTR